jgi:hypothetical protein
MTRFCTWCGRAAVSPYLNTWMPRHWTDLLCDQHAALAVAVAATWVERAVTEKEATVNAAEAIIHGCQR